jgi:ubiquinone/menaquinone biosynthesis C-methylase UbiE
MMILGFLSAPLKYFAELRYWKKCLKADKGTFRNHWYRDAMLLAAGEQSDEFVRNLVLADFGCGPRGTLTWATEAKERLGIDVLTASYRKLGIREQNMTYIECSETQIPLATGSVDILFTMNALDHVLHFPIICRELHRILKPGGRLCAFINIDNPPTIAEPSPLSEDLVQTHLLPGFRVLYKARARKATTGKAYDGFRDESLQDPHGEMFLLVRAEKLDE